MTISGGFGGSSQKNFQARYRSPWPPLEHTSNFYPAQEDLVVVHFCMCNSSTLLGGLHGLSRSVERDFLCPHDLSWDSFERVFFCIVSD